ncbi:MAG: relaxase/mobilization nuclease domain-containing protein [Clostridiales bacterium]|nr:relaxase/mobilization nuclease domain-containing protein [Clostridiales bacterium]
MIVFFRDEACGIGDFMAAYMGRRIADYIGHRFQTIFAVHTNTENIHIHFIINPVSYRDGSLYKTTTTNLKRYYEIINQMYGEIYHVESIGGYGYCIEK